MVHRTNRPMGCIHDETCSDQLTMAIYIILRPFVTEGGGVISFSWGTISVPHPHRCPYPHHHRHEQAWQLAR